MAITPTTSSHCPSDYLSVPIYSPLMCDRYRQAESVYRSASLDIPAHNGNTAAESDRGFLQATAEINRGPPAIPLIAYSMTYSFASISK